MTGLSLLFTSVVTTPLNHCLTHLRLHVLELENYKVGKPFRKLTVNALQLLTKKL